MGGSRHVRVMTSATAGLEMALEVAGIGPGMKLIAVNARRFSPKVMDEALAATKKPGHAITLLIEDGDFYRTYKLDYQGGPRQVKTFRRRHTPRD